jgi:hypothetical protein
MHTITGPTDGPGPMLDVLIGLPGTIVRKLQAAGSPIPHPVQTTALIDTGAETSCVAPSLLRPLLGAGLSLSRIVMSNLPALGGVRPALEYTISLTVLHASGDRRSHLLVHNLPVLEQEIGQLGHRALLGLDVLKSCILILNGPGNSFTLGY